MVNSTELADILAVGTVAFDSIETPAGKRDRCFGGSASYFSCAASFFSKSKIIAVVGEDFPQENFDLLSSKGIDISGIEVMPGEKTFFWEGKYTGDMNEAQTLGTHLNVLEGFDPKIQTSDTQPILFLANIDPDIQFQTIDRKSETKLTIMDTMNFWIDIKMDPLKKVLAKVDVLILNDGEAKMLTGDSNVIQAGRNLQKEGPRIVIIKKGEHGSVLFYEDEIFALPAYPLEKVLDPTGAGDSFAGGVVGFLAKEHEYSFNAFKHAIAWGTVVASFTCEGFSLDKLSSISGDDLVERFAIYVRYSAL